MKSSSRRKLFYYIGVLLCFSISQCSGSKVIRTSARNIAVRAGAAQFKESIEETDHATKRDRRLADTHDQDDNFDEDYEVYQGVVGRPGIDFPVLVGIPITGFNCRRMGNGYFADLETDCQVFHICDSGRKISFLCPNGTIFKQNELICDWWFKVDCQQSPRQYAESSELLQRHRTRDRPIKFSTTGLYSRDSTTKSSLRSHKEQSVQQQQVHINEGRSRGRPTQVTPSPTPKHNVELINGDDFDFEDVNDLSSRSTTRRPSSTFTRSTVRSRHGEDESPVTLIDHIDYSTETQEVAESGSFVQPNGGYALNRPNDEEDYRKNANKNTKKPEKVLIVVEDDSVEVPAPASKSPPRSTTTATTTKSTTTTSTTAAPTTTTTFAPISASTRPSVGTTTVGATTFSRRGASKYRGGSTKSELTLTTSTPSFDNENSYTTAKRLGTTLSNVSPFYTPTVPTIINRNKNDNEVSSTIPTPIQFSTTESTPVDHAMEMIKTLKKLESIDDDILPPFEITKALNTPPKVESARTGLNIPPSSGPDTLNSLANYFATAVESHTLPKSNKTETSENSTDESIVDAGLLSSKTIAKYDQLFGKETNTTDELQKRTEVTKTSTEKYINSRISSIEDHTEDLSDLKTEFSTNSLFSSTAPQVRELAQVFTHALSAYLHDPIEFRQILTGIRPTEPPSILDNDQLDAILSNRIGRTDVYGVATGSTNGATYLPTSTVSSITTEIPASTSDDLEVLDFSDVTVFSNLKKDTTESGINLTTENQDGTTTTSSLGEITTLAGLTSTVYPIKQRNAFNVNADKTPASDIIAKDLSRDITTTTDTITTATGYPLAMEINKIVLDSTSFPYLDGEDAKTDSDIGNYFPDDLGNTNKTATTYKPYGNGLNVNSTPISNEKLFTNTQSVPLRWNDDESSTISTISEIQSTTVPSLVSKLAPPSPSSLSIVKNSLSDADVEDTTVPDEEHLQRAHSQSIVAGVNELKNREAQKIGGGKSGNLIVKNDVSSTGNPIASRLYPIRGHYITEKYSATTEQITTESVQFSTTEAALTTTTTVNSRESTTSFADTGKQTTNNPWQSLAYTAYLDPLTINDGLMEDFNGSTTETTVVTTNGVKSGEVTTSAPNKKEKFTLDSDSTTSGTTESTTSRITTNNAGPASGRRGKTFPTTSFPSSRFSIDTVNVEEDLQSIDEPMEIMRERANEIFGNLNETQANSLMHVMKTADENKTVRKLILLLIQTCDDDYNKTLEESRNVLLNALIGMDGDDTFDGEPEIKIISARRFPKNSEPIVPIKLISTTTTTSSPPTTTNSPTTQQTTVNSNSGESSTISAEFRIDLSDENDLYTTTTTQTNLELTTTNEPTTSTIIPSVETTTGTSSTTTVLDSREDITTTLTPITTTPQSTTTVTEEITTIRSRKRTGKSLDSSLGIADLETSENNSKHSDERALELLKSLYSLASKWGKR